MRDQPEKGAASASGPGGVLGMELQNRRLVHITTVPLTVRAFLMEQIRDMAERGFDVHVVTGPGDDLEAIRDVATVHVVGMRRQISPLVDAIAMLRLVKVLRGIRPEIVHVHTPKAALLGLIAARMIGTAKRVYTVHGLPAAAAKGVLATVLKLAERLTCLLATDVTCVSPSLAEEVGRLGIRCRRTLLVLGHGSIDGVDALVRFDPAKHATARSRVRSELGIASEEFVLGFVGRLAQDKGLQEIATIFQRLQGIMKVRLLIVGEVDERDPADKNILGALRKEPRVHFVGFQCQPERYYAAIDCLCLPSHREGLGMVALEAAAMEVPVVAFRIPGVVDAVVDGITGTLVEFGDTTEMFEAVRAYVQDKALRLVHGRAGRRHVLMRFNSQQVREELLAVYAGSHRSLSPVLAVSQGARTSSV